MISLPCRLGGHVAFITMPDGGCAVTHTSGLAHAIAPTQAAAWVIVAGLAEATTYGEADGYAYGLLSQDMSNIDRFMADPEGAPSPGGIAARRAMFRP